MSQQTAATSNDPFIEELWARKAHAYMEAYAKILKTYPNLREMRLSRIDDEIYTEFRKEFPDMRVDVFDEDWSKSPEGKEKWRAFLSRYDDSKLREHNTGTLMRIDVSKPFTPENVCLVTRLQFYCIEIARNREGVNDNANKEFNF